MQLSKDQKSIIVRVINVFETGSPDGDYSKIVVYNDGKDDQPQITYGRSQTTQESGLPTLVQMYVEAGGKYSAELAPYLNRIRDKALTEDERFKDLLRKAGRTDPVMQNIQDNFFDERYYTPSMKWADRNGFTLALSGLVIYDSHIHSGQIRSDIRKRFPEKPPAKGGDEKAWITAYVRERHEWLLAFRSPEVRKSSYRTRDLKREISKGNWDLSMLPVIANGVPVHPKT